MSINVIIVSLITVLCNGIGNVSAFSVAVGVDVGVDFNFDTAAVAVSVAAATTDTAFSGSTKCYLTTADDDGDNYGRRFCVCLRASV